VQDSHGRDGTELDYWKSMLSRLESEREMKVHKALTVIIFSLMNLMAFLLTDQYAILWILSSLLFCVFSVLFLIMPTTRRSRVPEPKGAKMHVDRSSLMENKELIGLALWNGFFINSQPMAFGIIAIFSFDIPLIVLLGIIGQVLTLEVTGLLLLQSVGMILFYVSIVRIKPYSIGFLEDVRSIGRSVRDILSGRSIKRFRNIFLTVLVLSVFVLSLIAAMLLPGSSIRMLRGDSNVDLAKGAAPLVLIFLSQFILVREAQGISSRRMAENLLERKLSLMESRENVRDKGLEGLEEQMPMFFKVIRHDIFGFMPVYMMSPDMGEILRERTAS
jgi:hypothetical protein